MRRCTILLLVLGWSAAALAEDEPGLDQPPTSARAKRYREEGLALWKSAEEAAEKARRGEPLEPEAAEKALATIEEAVFQLERSIREEWNNETNIVLADAVRGWFRLKEALAKPDPADPAVEKAAERESKERLRDARRFVLDYAKAMKITSQFRRCDRCDGRGDLRSMFGDTQPCPRCGREGHLMVREGILEAHWLPYSPLHRASGRNQGVFNQKLRGGARNRQRLAPFIHTASIDGKLEDHGLYVRVNTKEKVQEKADSKKTEKVKKSYVVFSVGRVWYLYNPNTDSELFTAEEPPKEEKKE